ncbi:MAG: endolytic transglycosylase MltG [Halanaerobiales bacterium]
MKKAAIIFLLFVLLLTGLIRLASLVQPVDRTAENEIHFRIESGRSTGQIARELEEEKLINSDLLFKLVVGILRLENSMQAGVYEFKRSENTLEIINKIARGRVANVRVTIPEGYTLEEVAEILSERTLYEKEELLEAAQKDVYDRSYLPEDNESIRYVLEGFIFPDTYDLPMEKRPEDIFRYLLDKFEEKAPINEFENEDKDELFEIITIASLIEREAKLNREKPLISAVIYNRIQLDMKLQIDATIQYSLDERKERLLYEDLKVDSPYNTYQHRGLPPGPICNPGEESIQASIEPADVDYLFYFALKDGSHIFTESYPEHLKKQELLLKQDEN